MEEALQQRINELNRCRQDYDDLFDKFKQMNLFYDDKERFYKSKINELTDSLTKLTEKYKDLQRHRSHQEDVKKAFQADAKLLEEAAHLLELREQDISKLLASAQQNNLGILHEMKELTEKNRLLLEEKETLTMRMTKEMIAKTEYNLLEQQLMKLNTTIEEKMINKEKYGELLEENTSLRKHMVNNMIDLKEYETLHNKLQALERRLPFDFIAKEDYYKLQEAYRHLEDEKNLLEESARLIEETRDQNLKDQAEQDAKVSVLKNRVEQYDRELSELRMLYDRAIDESTSLRGEISRSEEERRSIESRFQASEVAKTQLMTQLSKAKLAVRHEVEAKQAIIDQKTELEKSIEQVKIDYSNKLIDSNNKIKEIFDASEDQLKRHIYALQEENTSLQGTIDNLHSEMDSLREQNRLLERDLLEYKSQVGVQQAHTENGLRENTDLRQQIIALREEKHELSHRLEQIRRDNEDFKSSILTQLTPAATTVLKAPSLAGSAPSSSSNSVIQPGSSGNSTVLHSFTAPSTPRGIAPSISSVSTMGMRNGFPSDFSSNQLHRDDISLSGGEAFESLAKRLNHGSSSHGLVPPSPPYLDAIASQYRIVHDGSTAAPTHTISKPASPPQSPQIRSSINKLKTPSKGTPARDITRTPAVTSSSRHTTPTRSQVKSGERVNKDRISSSPSRYRPRTAPLPASLSRPLVTQATNKSPPREQPSAIGASASKTVPTTQRTTRSVSPQHAHYHLPPPPPPPPPVVFIATSSRPPPIPDIVTLSSAPPMSLRSPRRDSPSKSAGGSGGGSNRTSSPSLAISRANESSYQQKYHAYVRHHPNKSPPSASSGLHLPGTAPRTPPQSPPTALFTSSMATPVLPPAPSSPITRSPVFSPRSDRQRDDSELMDNHEIVQKYANNLLQTPATPEAR